MRNVAMVSCLFLATFGCGTSNSSTTDGGISNGGATTGGTSATGGSTTNGGQPSNGGQMANGGSVSMGGNSSVVIDEAGKASLMGADGITGKVGNTTFAYSTAPVADSVISGVLRLVAKDTGTGSWNLNVPAVPGEYPCGNTASPSNATIQLNLSKTGVARGTALPSAGGSCTVKVQSVFGRAVGSFTATIYETANTLHTVTEGYFNLKGLPDCSLANDPGVSATDEAATIAVTASASPFECGSNAKLVLSSAKWRNSDSGSSRQVVFNGMLSNRSAYLSIFGVEGVGTFTCGQTVTLTGGGTSKVRMYLGDNNRDGDCTINITSWTDSEAVGTYSATLGQSGGGLSTSFKGSFRTLRSK